MTVYCIQKLMDLVCVQVCLTKKCNSNDWSLAVLAFVLNSVTLPIYIQTFKIYFIVLFHILTIPHKCRSLPEDLRFG